MLNIIASSIKTGEGPNNTRYRQRKKSFCTQFLQFAMMFSLGLLTITGSNSRRGDLVPESKSLCGGLLSKSSSKLISSSTLLGKHVTEREKKKIDKTLADIATLVPVTILMLIPVSAVGHAAMLTTIKRYIPALNTSPYCSERLNMVKKLKRTKKMEIQIWSNIEDNARRDGWRFFLDENISFR